MTMDQNIPVRRLPAFTSFLPFAFILSLIGWGGIVYLIIFSLPTIGPRWLLFFLVTLAMTGTGLPIVVFLNIRFPSVPPIDTPVVIRQASWMGVYGGIVVWLQLGRILTPSIGMLIAFGLVIIESLIRMREKSQWKPQAQAEVPATIDEFQTVEDDTPDSVEQ